MPNTVEHKDWLFVPIPRDADSIELHDEESPAFITYHTGMGTEDYDILRDTLPPGSWQIIGKGDEDIWEGIVEARKGIGIRPYYGYVDYGSDVAVFTTPTESGHSLLKSLGLEPATTLVLKKNNNGK